MQDKKITNLQEAYNLIDKYPFYYCNCSKELKENFKLAIYAITKDIKNYNQLIDDFRNNKTIASLAIKVDPFITTSIPDKLLKDTSIIKDIIDSLEHHNIDMTRDINRSSIANIVKKVPEIQISLSPRYRECSKIIAVVNSLNNGTNLVYQNLTKEQEKLIKENKLEDIVKILDNHKIIIKELDKYDDNHISIESEYIPWNAGNHYPMSFNFDGTVEDFLEQIENYYEGFDVEEYVKEALECKMNGDSTVPHIDYLLEDANQIDAMFRDLSDDVDGYIYYNKNKSLNEQIVAAQSEVEETISNNKNNLER